MPLETSNSAGLGVGINYIIYKSRKPIRQLYVSGWPAALLLYIMIPCGYCVSLHVQLAAFSLAAMS